jgi:hypothetical protein
MLNEESRDNGKAKDAAKDKNFKNWIIY